MLFDGAVRDLKRIRHSYAPEPPSTLSFFS
jgi:hypothetical protein